jgi:opacity protein-like surface antigen
VNKHLIATLATSCALFTAATGAFAADYESPPMPSGYYLAVSGGLVQIFDIDTDAPGGSSLGGPGDTEFNYGGRGALSIGRYLSDNVRAEIEFAGSSTGADAYDPDGLASFDLDGSLRVYSLLAKIDYEMEIFSWWHPYIGVGIGGAVVDVHDIGPGGNSLDGSDIVFAGAIEGGSKFTLSDTVDLFSQTQLMVLSDVEVDFDGTALEGTLNSPLILSSSIGLRIKF